MDLGIIQNTKLVRVTDLDHETTGDKDVIVRVVGRDEDGKRDVTVVGGTEPYLFAPADEDVQADSIMREDLHDEDGEPFESYDGRRLKKVVVQLPKHVKQLRDEYSITYEADIRYEQRVSVDYGLSGYIRVPDMRYCDIQDIETNPEVEPDDQITPRVCLADIEVLPEYGMEFDDFTEEAPNEIIMITAYDNWDDEYHVFVLDPERHVNTKDLKHHLGDHWNGHELAPEYVQADFNLVRADTEAALLNSFLDYIEDKRPDLLSGWNWVNFDHRYLINRIRQIRGVDLYRLSDIGGVGGYIDERKIDGLPGFDMMRAYCDQMVFHDWRSRSLDYVSNEKLGIGKVEDISIHKGYENERSKLLAYNIIDVQLTVALDKMAGIHEFFYELAELSSVQIYDTFSEMRLVDGFMLSHRNTQEILPNAEEVEVDDAAGGLVLSPSRGIAEWVGVFDLKSLYPSSIITANISRETMTNNNQDADIIVPWMPEKVEDFGGDIEYEDIVWDAAKGQGLKLDKQGIMPKYLRLLFAERDAKKKERSQYDVGTPLYDVWDNKQYAVKVIMNSFFGVSNNKYYRLSSPELGDTITGLSRFVLWNGVQIARELGYEVRYGDTDSVMVELAEEGEFDHMSEQDAMREVVRRGEEIEEAINERIDRVADEIGIGDEHPYLAGTDMHGNDRHCFKYEFEKMYRRFFQHGKKKRYAGLIVWKEGQYLKNDQGNISPKPDITGYESKRSDSTELTAEAQPEIIKKILNAEGFDEVSRYLKEQVDSINDGTIELRKIAKPGTIKDPINTYTSPTQTIRGALYANEHLGYEWRQGDQPWVYYIKKTPAMTPDTDVIALEWWDDMPDGFVLDTNEHIRKALKGPLKPILKERGWDFEELAAGARTESIDVGPSTGVNPFAANPANDDDEEEGDGGVLGF